MMKKNVILIGLSILLASCSFDISIGGNSSFFISTNSSNVTSLVTTPNTSSSEISTPSISSTTTSTTTPFPSTTLSPSTTPVVPTTPVTVDRTISLYGINDFHGAIVPNLANYEQGIIKIGSFFKKKGQESNTLLINAGDMWQGSIESNYNRGKLLTDCMNYIEFDAFTIGNHEFDWGAEYIRENRKRKDETTNYQTPFLAANIYNYDISKKQVLDYADFGDKYTIRTLENGLRVGIIGVIGSDQITSITSTFADDFTFIEPVNVIKTLSDELRTEHDVDVVIASVHSDQDDFLNTGITSVSNVSNKRYVDAVFCAHSHQNEKSIENGVPFVQASYNGRSYSNIELVISPSGEVTSKSYSYVYTSNINVDTDTKLNSMVQKYLDETKDVGDEVIAKSNGTLSSDDTLMNLVTTAMYESSKSLGYDVSYAITNSGRSDLPSGTITYSNLFKSLPFDNEIYILEVNGNTLKKVLNYSWIGMYRADKAAISTSKTYRIAVIDYLAVHRNINREYNYFTTFTYVNKLTMENVEMYNYRDITANYLRSLETINTSNFSSSLNQFNKSKLSSNI